MAITSKEWTLSKKFEKNPIRFIDLFCGIGGLSYGFELLNCKCVFANDNDKNVAMNYRNKNVFTYGDIRDIPNENIPSHDILLAGFPCQPFSTAGKRKGFKDSRGSLFFEIIRILKFHKPKFFVLENVKGILSHDGGKTIMKIREELVNIGYRIFSSIINTKDFDINQNRERLFIVGTLNHSSTFKFPIKEKIPLKQIVGDLTIWPFLEKNVDEKFTLSDKAWNGFLERKKRNKEKGYGFGYSLFDAFSFYVNTITARYYKDGAEILIQQINKNPRKLTPRECARFQGFPDDFKIPKSNTAAYKLLGNAVSANVSFFIAQKILMAGFLKTLNSFYRNGQTIDYRMKIGELFENGEKEKKAKI